MSRTPVVAPWLALSGINAAARALTLVQADYAMHGGLQRQRRLLEQAAAELSRASWLIDYAIEEDRQ